MGADLEDAIRAHHDAGRYAEALTVALEGYGREVMGFLMIRLRRDETLASEAFSQLGEDLWKGIEGFGWRSSFRTWMYVLARNAASRQGRDRHRRDGVALSEVSEQVARVRTQTLTFLRTEAKDRFAELRAELSPEEQQLLVLRVKRGLSWNEIATILDEEVAMEDEAAIMRAAARYRQRFKSVKDRLRKRAAADKVPD